MEKLLLITAALCLIICLCFGVYSVTGDMLMPITRLDEESADRAESTAEQTEATDTDTSHRTDPVSDIVIETESVKPTETDTPPETETDAAPVVATETVDSTFETETRYEDDTKETEIITDTESAEITEVPESVVTELLDTEAYETETETVCETETETEAASEDTEELPKPPEIAERVTVPILMYHALTENADEASSTVITAAAFEAQIAALTEAGYTSLFFGDLRDYVYDGKALPEKPILITFDDGYTSNLTLAAPILEKYGQRATVSVIGISVGKNTYKDTGVAMYPHFSLEEARKAYESGVLDFQSHTYDMHQNNLDTDPRKGMLPKENESEEEYIEALRSDFSASKAQIEEGVGNRVFVIVYPHGKSNPLLDTVLFESGAEISVTVESGINVIEYGQEQTLRSLRRINMNDRISGEKLIAVLEEYLNNRK